MFVFCLAWLVWFTLLYPFTGFLVASLGALVASMIVISED